MNHRQKRAIEDRYRPEMRRFGLPEPAWPRVPTVLADARRRAEIEAELHESRADVLITLGDEPLRWFARYYGAKAQLRSYGRDRATYGRLHSIRIGGRDIQLLPVVHPRHAARLGTHSSTWAGLHQAWASEVASGLLNPLPYPSAPSLRSR